MITTTLNRIKSHSPCKDGWEKLLNHLGKTKADDEPLPYAVIVESNGLLDAIWCCRAEPQYEKEWREFACWCALSVKHLWDMPPIVEEYLTTRNESIRSAALDAALAASSASWAAARAALDAASAAARDAFDAASAAKNHSSRLDAALDAASAAARDALDARDALAQKQEFLKIVGLNY